MLFNYLKVAFRSLWRYKGYTFINALGLSIGIGCCLFITAVCLHEYSFDNYHAKKDQIYLLIDQVTDGAGDSNLTATSPAPWASAMYKDYPEIIDYVRYINRGHVFRYKEKLFNDGVLYCDPGVFRIFDFEFIKGDPAIALVEPYSMVLTKNTANKYFGDEDPIGKVIEADGDKSFTVTGVIEEVPSNTYRRYRYILSMSTFDENTYEPLKDWRAHYSQTFFLLDKNADPEKLQSQFKDFIYNHIDPEFRDRYRPSLLSLNDLHFAAYMSNHWGETLPVMYVYIFIAISFFALFIACINFTNLATARSARRALEIGIRKVMGAQKKQLVKQFLTETFVISFVALIFGILFVEIALPWYQALTTREVSIDYLNPGFYHAVIIGITFLVGILAGSYPAFYLSSIKPIRVMKKDLVSGSKASKLRRILVITQFSVAVFMIIANIILYNQLNYMQTKDLGFNKKDVIVTQRPSNNSFTRQLTIKNEVSQDPGILNVSLASREPGDGYSLGRFIPEGMDIADGISLPNLSVDYDYLPSFEIDIINGRNFSLEFPTDTSQSVIVNQTAVRQFEWDNPIGKEIRWLDAEHGEKVRTVIGVVEDFHYSSLHSPIRPLIIHYTPAWMNYYLIRTDGNDITALAESVQEKWKVYEPERPSWYYILEEDLGVEYRFENIIGDLLIKFTIITMVIACLGLLGLASFSAEQRTREIGIRKVLGATPPVLFYVLSREFIIYILIANIIAWPLTYYAMSLYLQEFAYRVNISWMVFIYSAVLSVLLSLATMSYQIIKTAMANPVNTIRYE